MEGEILLLFDSSSAIDGGIAFKAVTLPTTSDNESPSRRGFLPELLPVALVTEKKLRMLFCAILFFIVVPSENRALLIRRNPRTTERSVMNKKAEALNFMKLSIVRLCLCGVRRYTYAGFPFEVTEATQQYVGVNQQNSNILTEPFFKIQISNPYIVMSRYLFKCTTY